MRNLNKILLLLLLLSVNILSINAQWETKSPADQTLDGLQTEYAPLPSDNHSLRSRPIDETPIGGADVSLSEASYLWFLLVGGVYVIARYRRTRS